MSILVIAEHDQGQLKVATRQVVRAACACGDDVHVLVMGADCDAVAKQAATLAGVTKVLVANDAQFQPLLAEVGAHQILAMSRNYSHILANASASGSAMLPRVAAKLNVEQITAVTRVIDAQTYERPIYAGNAIATVKSQAAVHVMTVRAAAFEPVDTGASATIEALVPTVKTFGSTCVSRTSEKTNRPELSSAKRVIAGGQGVGSAENFKMIEQLADKLGAAVGASRAAVDAGYVPNDLQVGQTGKIIAPQLYLAIGISGAVQHVAGIKSAKTIVAINQDVDAPIFLSADYGLVGDLNEIVPQLIQALDA